MDLGPWFLPAPGGGGRCDSAGIIGGALIAKIACCSSVGSISRHPEAETFTKQVFSVPKMQNACFLEVFAAGIGPK